MMAEANTFSRAQRNEALVRDYLGWTVRGDLKETLERVWAEKIAYHGRELGEHTTRDSLFQMLSGFGDAMTDIRCDIISMLSNDDYVLAVMRTTGNLMDESGTRQPVDFSAIDMWRVKDGKLVEQWVVEGIADHNNPERARVG